MIRRPPRSTLFPTRRSSDLHRLGGFRHRLGAARRSHEVRRGSRDRKSTRLNSSHGYISYAVFCLKKKKKPKTKLGEQAKIYDSYRVSQVGARNRTVLRVMGE